MKLITGNFNLFESIGNWWAELVSEQAVGTNFVTLTVKLNRKERGRIMVNPMGMRIGMSRGGIGIEGPPVINIEGPWEYLIRTPVDITFESKEDYEFDRWGGDASGNRNPLTITMGSDKTIIAYAKTICGDGSIKEPYEECEVGNLNGESCSSLGFSGEGLICDPTYCIFDVRGCNQPELPDLNDECEDRTTYESCQRRGEKLYCGYGNENLISNGGFETGDSELSLDRDGANTEIIYGITSDKKYKGSKSYYFEVPSSTNTNDKEISLFKDQEVDELKYYKLSFYAYAEDIIEEKKPEISISCYTEDDEEILDKEWEVGGSDVGIELEKDYLISGERWKQYRYGFLAPWNADYCKIKPVMFHGGRTGKVWIDSIRLEKLEGEPTLAEDCGICGCPTDRPYCTESGTCSDDRPEGITEECGNEIDDNLNGVPDEFDVECEGEMEDYYFLSLKKNGLKVSNDEPYTDSNIIIDCAYNVFDEDEDVATRTRSIMEDSLKCIELDDNIECESKRSSGASGGFYNARFINCDVGSQEEEKIITCRTKEDCNWMRGDVEKYDEDGELFKTIEIQEYSYCTRGIQGYLDLTSIEADDDYYEVGDTIEITANVDNLGNSEKIIVKAALIDLNEGEEIEEKSSQEKTIQEGGSEEFNIDLTIPSFNTNVYRLYVKAYVKGEERTGCIQETIDIEIEIPDDDDPIESEPDEPEPEDETCDEEEEETRDCDTEEEGICADGIQICEEGLWGECQQLRRRGTSEIPGNDLDDNCDGDIDEEERGGGGSGNERDSDGDDLPDDWEVRYFRDIDLQGPYNDYDNDGVTNLQEYIDNTDPTNKSDRIKESSLLWLWIVLGVILVIAIIFFVIKLASKPKYGGGGRSYVDPTIRNYVQSSLSKGFTKHQIRQALLTKGWSPAEINKAL